MLNTGYVYFHPQCQQPCFQICQHIIHESVVHKLLESTKQLVSKSLIHWCVICKFLEHKFEFTKDSWIKRWTALWQVLSAYWMMHPASLRLCSAFYSTICLCWVMVANSLCWTSCTYLTKCSAIDSKSFQNNETYSVKNIQHWSAKNLDILWLIWALFK